MIFGAGRPRRPRPARTPRASRSSRSDFDASAGEALPPRLIPSLRQLVSTAVSLAHTRIALAGVELEEEMQRLIRAAAMSFIALLVGFMALVVATFTIVLAVAPEYRVLTMVIITLVYVLVAGWALMQVRAVFRNRPPIFAATLAELEKDKETLSHLSRAHEAAERARERAGHAEDTFEGERVVREGGR